MGILIGLAVAFMLAGAIFYNKLRVRYYGVLGVGGSYMALIGMMCLAMVIGALFGAGFENSAELVVGIIFMLIGIGYLVYVMICRCDTVMQRVLLPFAAALIALGFCWRFLAMLFLKIPMSNGAPTQQANKFPAAVIDAQGETWRLASDSGDNAEYYCPKTGARTTFWYTGDYVNFPYGWRAC